MSSSSASSEAVGSDTYASNALKKIKGLINAYADAYTGWYQAGKNERADRKKDLKLIKGKIDKQSFDDVRNAMKEFHDALEVYYVDTSSDENSESAVAYHAARKKLVDVYMSHYGKRPEYHPPSSKQKRKIKEGEEEEAVEAPPKKKLRFADDVAAGAQDEAAGAKDK